MSTLRISNIEAKADGSSPTIDEKVKITNSQGEVLMQLDGKTSGITTVGINTTEATLTVSGNNVTFSGSVASSGVSTFSQLNVSSQLNVGVGGTVITTSVGGNFGLGTNDPILGKCEIHCPGTTNHLILKDTTNNWVSKVQVSTGGTFTIKSGDTEHLRIDTSGRVTLPYQPTFYAWINSASVTVGSGGVFPFNATVFNVGSHFDTTTNIGRFTAPVSGYYLFGCTVADDDGAEFVSKIVTFYKNGGAYRDIIEGLATMNAHFEIHQTALMQLNSGDYADVRMRNGSVTLNGGSDGFPYRCSFYGYLLG